MHKYLTEFIGVCFFVASIGFISVSGSPAAPFAIGLSLALLVYMGGHLSGAHYNPAVSLALVVRGKLSFFDFLPYLIAQITGAFVGAAMVLALTGKVFGPLPAEGVDPVRAMLAEALFTCLLCLVVLHTATVAKVEGNSYYGLAIGGSVTVGAICVGPISGAALNPAVALGPAVVRAMQGDAAGLAILGVYVVGPFFGALVANALFAMQTGEGIFAEEPRDETETTPSEDRSGRGRLRVLDHRDAA